MSVSPSPLVFAGAQAPQPAPARRASSASRHAAEDRELSALMRAAQDGDQAAYAPLVRRTMPLLQRALRTRNRFLQASDRDDLMQKLAILSSGDGGI